MNIKDYPYKFLEIGEKYFEEIDLTVELKIIDGADGKNTLYLKRNEKIIYIIEYHYNRLDYNLGVSVYVLNESSNNRDFIFLPKKGYYSKDIFGYTDLAIEKLCIEIIDYDKKIPLTKCINHSDFSGYSSIVAHIQPRQICDLTILNGCKFGSLSYRSEIALYFATNSYTNRYSI